MNCNLRRRALTAALVFGIIGVWAPGSVFAHVEFEDAPATVAPDTDIPLTLHVANESETAGDFNVSVITRLPEGWTGVSCEEKPTWTCEITTVSQRVEIHFEKDDGAGAAEDELFEFTLHSSATLGTASFPTLQTYALTGRSRLGRRSGNRQPGTDARGRRPRHYHDDDTRGGDHDRRTCYHRRGSDDLGTRDHGCSKSRRQPSRHPPARHPPERQPSTPPPFSRRRPPPWLILIPTAGTPASSSRSCCWSPPPLRARSRTCVDERHRSRRRVETPQRSSPRAQPIRPSSFRHRVARLSSIRASPTRARPVRKPLIRRSRIPTSATRQAGSE